MSNNRKQPFDYFWEEIIHPSIKFCLIGIDDSTKMRLNFYCTDIKTYKKDLNKMYNKKREWLKSEYLPNEGADARLDFHKLGAILCRCVIGNKPFHLDTALADGLILEIDKQQNLDNSEKLKKKIDSVYVNYKLAFLVGAGVAYADLFYWAKEKLNHYDTNSEEYVIYKEFLRLLDNQRQLTLYKKSNRHDDFVMSMIIALMKQDILMRDFDYLIYAASMFQWQEYTKKSILIDILNNINSGKYSLHDVDALM